MSNYFIEITNSADKDLHNIGHYIFNELQSPETARKTVQKIGSIILSLEEMPLRSSLIADERLAHLGIRKIVVDNYIVFYIVDEERKTVTIVRILYTRRDWENLL